MSKKPPRTSQETVINNPLENPPETPQPPERTFSKVTVNRVDDNLLGRARGFINQVNMEGPLEGIDSLDDLFNKALADLLPKLERKYNDGQEYKPPRRLQRGRKPSA